MSSSAVSTGKLRTFAKWSAVSLILIALTWAIVIWWWQTSQRVVTMPEMVLVLVVLPCTVLAAMALLARRAALRASARNSPDTPSLSDSPSDCVAEHQTSALPILHTWAIAADVSGVEELVEMLAEHRSRPRPDPVLTDEDGFPVLCSRAAQLDTAHAERWLEQNAAPHSAETADWRDAFLRTLALLELLIEQMAPDCAVLVDAIQRHDSIHDEDDATLRGASVHAASAVDFQLQVDLMVPDAFLPHERQLALDYLKALLHWPDGATVGFQLVPSSADAAAIGHLDRFRSQAQHCDSPQALLLMACDSMLCPRVLETWQADGLLFSSRSPNGLMAGEGAFGILCANDAALDALVMPPLCRLAGTGFQIRNHSADTPGKPSHAALDDAIRAALAASGLAGDRIGTVVCDTDHRTSRVLECIGSMTNHTSHLDAIQSRLAVNEACGHLGAATGLAILSAGVQHARAAAHPVLMFNVGHATARAAAILLPVSEA